MRRNYTADKIKNSHITMHIGKNIIYSNFFNYTEHRNIYTYEPTLLMCAFLANFEKQSKVQASLYRRVHIGPIKAKVKFVRPILMSQIYTENETFQSSSRRVNTFAS